MLLSQKGVGDFVCERGMLREMECERRVMQEAVGEPRREEGWNQHGRQGGVARQGLADLRADGVLAGVFAVTVEVPEPLQPFRVSRGCVGVGKVLRPSAIGCPLAGG
jgi:hypothetical protein